MLKVLIATRPDDLHSIYVKLALEQLGHQVTLWYTAGFPTQMTHTFKLSNQEFNWRVRGIDADFTEFDVVWRRRPSKPLMPTFLDNDDLQNANSENLALYNSFWNLISPNAFWINPISNLISAQSKLMQLKMAADIGMPFPKTLISNDPKEIKGFIHQTRAVVYKTLTPMSWPNSAERRLTYTAPLTLADLPQDYYLQSCVGIYQEKIEKSHELRVTYFGETNITVKLDSQAHPKGKVDWRRIPTYQLSVSPYQLPVLVDKQCRELMKRFRLQFACFDFIVTPENEYYFLELNEQGQFLWIEEVNPDIQMLAAFSSFVTGEATQGIQMKNFTDGARKNLENIR